MVLHLPPSRSAQLDFEALFIFSELSSDSPALARV